MPLMLTSRGTGCEAKWELLTRVFQDNFAVGRKMFSGYKGDYKREHSNGKMNYLKHFFFYFRARKQFYFCCFELRILVRLHGSRKLVLPVISQYLIAVDIIKFKYHLIKIKPRVCWHWLKMALK